MALIDKWYFTNLRSRKDKADVQELVAAIQGFPPGLLERFDAAIENEDLPDTAADLCELLIADGFSEWTHEASAARNPYLGTHAIAANWTRLRLIRHIIQEGLHAVMVTDNNYPVYPFRLIRDRIASAPSDMKLLVLNWQGDPYHQGFTERHYRALATMEPSGVPGILKNFTGVSGQVYFTQAGAREFLKRWRKYPDRDFQQVWRTCADPDFPVVYVCNPGLVLAINDMREQRFGIISE